MKAILWGAVLVVACAGAPPVSRYQIAADVEAERWRDELPRCPEDGERHTGTFEIGREWQMTQLACDPGACCNFATPSTWSFVVGGRPLAVRGAAQGMPDILTRGSHSVRECEWSAWAPAFRLPVHAIGAIDGDAIEVRMFCR
jgi:hypothetical protein